VSQKLSGNPILPGWYADPELHAFEGRFYVYPTYSAPYEEQTFFEVWSSDDLTDWKQDGIALDFSDVPWSTNRAAWAPSVAEKGGKYFLYFSAGDGAGLGVAVADHPSGPFVDTLGHPLVSEYHHGAQPIDAHAFIDDDGKAYLYWGGWRKAVMASLSDDMVHLTGEVVEITPEDYVEGPFMVKHNDRYIFMWSEGNWTDSTYRVAYADSDSPFGPFERVNTILGSEPGVADGAGHHSVLRIPGSGEYVICYHRRVLGDTNPHHRVTCLEELRFSADGSIEPIKLTNEGVAARRWGLSKA
jgi:beta-xylosidase